MINSFKFAVLIFTLFAITTTVANAVDIGDTAPNWALQNGAGRNINYYSDSEGKVSVLIYWATWCPYCASLMPHIQEVANQYQGKDVVFYAMNIIEDGDPAQFMREKGYTFDLILQADATMGDYSVPGTPSVFVVDSSHKVLYRRIPDTPDEEVKAAVNRAINSALGRM
jgi:thiol-disulfide isomerase/thioredoxin